MYALFPAQKKLNIWVTLFEIQIVNWNYNLNSVIY